MFFGGFGVKDFRVLGFRVILGIYWGYIGIMDKTMPGANIQNSWV